MSKISKQGRDYDIVAFPLQVTESMQSAGHYPEDGMGLRDYFAAKAMAAFSGIISAKLLEAAPDQYLTMIARWAYQLADTMLLERRKQ